MVLVVLDDGLGALSEREARLERGRLLHEAVDEVARQDLGISGDVENGLLGVDLGALSAGLGQGVNQVALELEQPRFEHGEEAARPGTDDEDVRLDHGFRPAKVGVTAGCPCNNGKSGVFNPGPTPAC